MPSLPSSLTNDLDGERGGIIGGGGGAVGGATSRVDGKAEGSGGLGRAVNVLAMEMLGENLMTLSQVVCSDGVVKGQILLEVTRRKSRRCKNSASIDAVSCMLCLVCCILWYGTVCAESQAVSVVYFLKLNGNVLSAWLWVKNVCTLLIQLASAA